MTVQKFDTFDYRGEMFFARKLPKWSTVQTPHFRLKQGRLYFCLGGQTIAAWPAKGKEMYLVLIQAKMFLSNEPGDFRLSRDQRKIRRLAVMLDKALLKAEDGPRHRTIFKQRLRLEKWLATVGK
ncbi:MAG TPA: hypothetical protein VHV29_10325 [Terriglobales bacterium]|jgi:hypothetical protein|nr:hypothetical protein [Terriglobales bacterium]